MKILDILAPENVISDLHGTTKLAVLEELASTLAANHPEILKDRLVDVLLEREKLGSTAIGEGIAIPHGKLPKLAGVLAVFGRSREGVDFQSLDGGLTQLFFLLVAPEDASGAHLKALARVSRLLRDKEFRQRLIAADGTESIYETIRQEDDKY
ncbi:MAG: PTS sugar transporter subunit IIA [Candidatus Binatia bacterium]|jgi:PTS system nitrogen regulatory IIA component